MIPFSGFMPAADAASAPPGGGKTAATGNGIQGASHTGDAKAPTDGAGRSFLQWVQRLMAGEKAATADTETGAAVENAGDDQHVLSFDQLQSMIAEALDRTSTETKDGKSEKNNGLDALSGLVPPWIIQAMQAQNDAGEPVDDDVQQALAALEEMMEASSPPMAEGPAEPSDGEGQARQAVISDQEADQLIKEMLAAKQEKSSPLSNAGPHSDGTGIDSDPRLAAQSLPAAAGGAKKAADNVSADPRGAAGPTDQEEAAAAVLTGMQTAASQDDPADFEGHGKQRRKEPMEMRAISENQLPKHHPQDLPQDLLKSANGEATQLQPAFQDAVKSVGVDTLTSSAHQSTTGQAASLPHLDPSAAKTYQTTVMDQIVDKATVRLEHGRSEMQIRLKPEFLGNVHMNIANEKDRLIVRILTDQPVVKDIIETNLHQLKAELQSQGLIIHKFDVTVSSDAGGQHHNDEFSQMFKQNSSQDGRRQPPEGNPERWRHSSGKPSDDDQPNLDRVNYFA